MTRYLIDGYNLYFKLRESWGELPRDRSHARACMLDLIEALAAPRGWRCIVYFDGTGGRRGAADLARPHVSTVYGVVADDAIAEAVGDIAGRTVVVSSDREVSTGARDAGASSTSSERFCEMLLKGMTGGAKSRRENAAALDTAGKRRVDKAGCRVSSNSAISAGQAAADAEKVTARKPGRKSRAGSGPLADIERAMLEEAGDMAALEREALAEPPPRTRHDRR